MSGEEIHINGPSSSPDESIVASFHLPAGSIPTSTFAMVWYLDVSGNESALHRMEGSQSTASAIGEMVSVVHQWLHHYGGDQ